MKRFIPLLLILILIGSLNVYETDANSGFILKAKLNEKEEYIELDWNVNDKSQPYTYQIQKKESGDIEFQTIPSKETVKVLNVYPEVNSVINYTTWDGTERSLPKSASAEMWMEEPNEEHDKGYGMGLIDVDPVAMTNFNENPESYLKNNDKRWEYDAVYFGGWDSNNKIDIGEESLEMMKDFIRDGHGVLFGHDTIDGIGNKNFNFGELRNYANLELFYRDDVGEVPMLGSTLVKNTKRGLLTQYPWNIEREDGLNIPYAHTGKQIAYGDIWLQFDKYEDNEYNSKTWKGPAVEHKGGTSNFYLTTWNNTAMIQTGHSNGEATPDEQKILANTLFYLSQITTDTEWKERSGVDTAAPDKVVNYDVQGNNLKITPPKDNGTEYVYQVIATGENSKEKIYSNEALVSIESGVKGYSYVIDKDKDTHPSGKINSENGEISLDKKVYKDHYLHIQAIDGNGNKSETSHIKLDKVSDRNPPSLKLTQTPNDWTNGSVTINIDAKDDESGIKSIYYKGENMIENSDFSEGRKGWGTQSNYGVWEVKDGILSLNDNTVNINKTYKTNAFKGSAVGAKYLVELDVRGKGDLVVRYGIKAGATRPVESRTKINNDDFKTYIFEVERYDFSNDNLIVEREGKNGYLEFDKIEVYEHKDVTDSKTLDVSRNGVYKFIAEDEAGNHTEESIAIDNIDKTSPSLSISQNTNDKTHENVTLKVNADDNESGIKNIMYIGDNVIKNGNFSEGLKHWHEDKPTPGTIGAGDIGLRNGYLYLGDNRVNINKAEQRDVFIDTAVGTKFYAEAIARGVGVINARYAMISGPHQENYAQDLISPTDFHLYKFGIERGENARDVFMIERRSKDGWIEVKDVKVFAQKDITDSRELTVTQNGTYTFVAEDNAGNITTKSHEVTNIDKYTKLHKPTISSLPNVSISGKTQNMYADVKVKIEDWRDSPGWKLNVKATKLTNGNYVLPMRLNGKDLSNSIEVIEKLGVRGVYEESIGNLEIQVPSTAQVGKYESKITWELIMAP